MAAVNSNSFFIGGGIPCLEEGRQNSTESGVQKNGKREPHSRFP